MRKVNVELSQWRFGILWIIVVGILWGFSSPDNKNELPVIFWSTV